MAQMTSDPLVSVSGQIPLARSSFDRPKGEAPSDVAVRPWGLRGLRSASGTGRSVIGEYSHELQMMVAPSGDPLIDGLRADDPSADTTSSVDGEDPPSSEDWNNDYAPEDPYQV